MPKRSKHAGRSPAEAEHSEEGMVVLHRSSFIEWRPSPIVSLASSSDGSLNIALRENGDLELYETSSLHQFQRIPGHSGAAPTSVAVVDDYGDGVARIFVSGLEGNIVEIDVENVRPLAISDSYGGAVWQLATEPVSDRPRKEPPIATPRVANTIEGGKEESDSDEDDETTRGTSGERVDEGALSASPRLAAACDDGCVRLFTVEPGVPGAAYSKSLPRIEGRVLAIAWHPNGRVLVSGGTDGCIHAWDTVSNRELLRITAGGGSSGDDLCVWALLVLSDGTIVSGDSSGSVVFWDARTGTQLARFTQHAADVLQLAASPDGRTVFAAGVDPKIAVFRLVKGGHHGEKMDWVFLSGKRPHTHDIRAMSIAAGKNVGEPRLFTGGNDVVLMAHSVERFLKEHPKAVSTCPQRPVIQTSHGIVQTSHGIATTSSIGSGREGQPSSSSAPWMLCAKGKEIDIWQLSRPAVALAIHGGIHGVEDTRDMPRCGGEGEGLLPRSMPIHLARVVNKGGAFVIASAISRDGTRVAFSDAHRVRCFTVEQLRQGEGEGEGEGGEPSLGGLIGTAPPPRLLFHPVALPSDLPAATHLHFHPKTGDLVALSSDGTLRVLHIPEPNDEKQGASSPPAPATVQHTIRELHDLRYKMWYKRDRARSAARRFMPAVDLAAWSPDGEWLAVAVRGRIHLVALSSHRIAAQLPASVGADQHAATYITALGFTPDSSIITVVTSMNQVTAFDVPGGELTEWSQRHGAALPRRILTLPGPVNGIANSPAGPRAVLLFSPEALCHVDFAAPITNPELTRAKKRRQREGDVASVRATPAGENLRAVYCKDPVLYVEAVGEKEILVVERAWADVWKGLAPPLYRHRYGS